MCVHVVGDYDRLPETVICVVLSEIVRGPGKKLAVLLNVEPILTMLCVIDPKGEYVQLSWQYQ